MAQELNGKAPSIFDNKFSMVPLKVEDSAQKCALSKK